MQLTTSYQMLAQAYLGSSAGDLYIRIYAKYSELDIPNNRSKVQYQSRAYFSGNYIYDQQSNGNVRGTGANQVNYSKSDAYNGGETVLGTTEGWVTHNPDGTMSISASAYLSFPNWGWGATASGSATLPTLHKAPEITSCTITAESNTQLSNLGLATGTIAQYLSNKTFTVTPELFDDATLSNFSIYHNNVLIGTSNTSTLQIDFSNVSELQTVLSEGVNYVGLIVSITDSKNGSKSKAFNFPVIKYTRPSMEVTSTTIRRKTGGGTTLTENLAVLNFTGTYYNGNDVIGNNNTPALQYKIWKRDLTEPSYSTTKVRQLDTDSILNYETNQIITFTTSNNDITISNFEIEDVGYLNAYKYKIKVSDSFTDTDASPYIKEDKVPTGVSVWSEYKDRVDFLKLTVGGYNPLEYNEDNEMVVGIWNDGFDEKTIYRKIIDTGSLPNNSTITVPTGLTNANIRITNISGVCYTSDGSYQASLNDFSVRVLLVPTNNLSITTKDNFSNFSGYVILEYIKTTD